MASDRVENDSPLHSIRSQDPQSKSLLKKDLTSVILQEDKIETSNGYVLNVAVQGTKTKPAIITYHDMGLNHVAQFQNFFSGDDMSILIRYFCVYHIDAPGQEENAAPLVEGNPSSPSLNGPSRTGGLQLDTLYEGKESDKQGLNSLPNTGPGENTDGWGSYLSSFLGNWSPNVPYPTMDELADMIEDVLKFYNIKSFVGFGVGAGANILSRFALSHPNQVEGLFLLESSSSVAGWSEWGYQKLNSFYLRKNSLTNFTNEYLIWHHFGRIGPEKNHDLIQAFRDYFLNHINNQNLALFIESYIKRTDLGIVRKTDGWNNGNLRNFRCPVMIAVGAESPHLQESELMYSNLEPSRASWLKLSDCGGMVLEEKPEKVFEAFRLFLQGMGYIPYLTHAMTSSGRRHTSSSYPSGLPIHEDYEFMKRKSVPNSPFFPPQAHKVSLILEGQRAQTGVVDFLGGGDFNQSHGLDPLTKQPTGPAVV